MIGGNLVVGNVGDSELVLCRGNTAVPLCAVHNMNKNAAEIDRVKEEGGVVSLAEPLVARANPHTTGIQKPSRTSEIQSTGIADRVSGEC